MNARDFVLSLADQVKAQGRDVKITEEENSIHMWAHPRSLWEYSVGAGAYRSPYSNRWTFTGIRAYPLFGATVQEKTRKRAHIIVEVYGTAYVKQEVPV
jgi:hypothetical protein